MNFSCIAKLDEGPRHFSGWKDSSEPKQVECVPLHGRVDPVESSRRRLRTVAETHLLSTLQHLASYSTRSTPHRVKFHQQKINIKNEIQIQIKTFDKKERKRKKENLLCDDKRQLSLIFYLSVSLSVIHALRKTPKSRLTSCGMLKDCQNPLLAKHGQTRWSPLCISIRVSRIRG